jgi:uncharacterized protein
MRTFALLAALAFAAPTFAQQSRPTEESVKALLQAAHTSDVVESVMAQLDAAARNGAQQMLNGKDVTEPQRQIIMSQHDKLMALVRQELNWPKLEPTIIEVYQNNFTQEQVDELVKFYHTDAGRALVEKMPAITQSMMERVQAHVQRLTPQIQALQRETVERLNALGQQHAAPAPAQSPQQTPPQTPAPAAAPPSPTPQGPSS